MDSPIVTRLFRQLFRHGHPACNARRNLTNLATALHRGRHQHQLRQVRALSFGNWGKGDGENGRGRRRGALTQSEKERAWQQRKNVPSKEKYEAALRYPTVTAMDLRSYKERPRRVRMLMRDFIEGQSFPHSGSSPRATREEALD